MFRRLEAVEVVEPLSVLFGEFRRRDGSPWVMLNIVESVDGATALSGGASALNDADDRELFLALRAVADVVLVGAQTVRSEGLGPVRMSAEMLEHRARAGLEGEPRLAILSRSLNIDPDHRVFSDPMRRPIVVAPTNADPHRLDRIAEKADIVGVDTDRSEAIIDALAPAQVILCEGGPSVNSLLIAAGVVDEINLTISPILGLGQSKRVASDHFELNPYQKLVLDRTWTGDHSLFLRYIRESDSST